MSKRKRRKPVTNQATAESKATAATDVEPESKEEAVQDIPQQQPEEQADEPNPETAESYIDEDGEPLVLTFEEVVVDRLLEGSDGMEAIRELMEEMSLCVDVTDDPEALDRAAQVVGAISDGLQEIVTKLAAKLPAED